MRNVNVLTTAMALLSVYSSTEIGNEITYLLDSFYVTEALNSRLALLWSLF